MSHWAQIDKDNIVTQVTAGPQEETEEVTINGFLITSGELGFKLLITHLLENIFLVEHHCVKIMLELA